MVPMAWALRKCPFSSPGLPAVPTLHPVISQGTISPLRRATLSPVSLSLMGWPSPAKTPSSSSAKVRVPTPAEESRTHIPARHCPEALSHTGVRVVNFCSPLRIYTTSTACPSAASSASFTASLLSVRVCPMQMTRSPRRSPAALAGFDVPPLACPISENPTMSAPSENILTPKGVPQTVTLGRSATTARMVLMGNQPPSVRVVW